MIKTHNTLLDVGLVEIAKSCSVLKPLLGVVQPPIGVDIGGVSSQNRTMLEVLLGSKTAELVFLHLYHYAESYPTAVAKDLKMGLGQVQRQFERFENAGILISKLVGRTRVYMFNPKSPFARKLKELVAMVYDSIPLSEKEKLFAERRMPRRKGKPVIRTVAK